MIYLTPYLAGRTNLVAPNCKSVAFCSIKLRRGCHSLAGLHGAVAGREYPQVGSLASLKLSIDFVSSCASLSGTHEFGLPFRLNELRT